MSSLRRYLLAASCVLVCAVGIPHAFTTASAQATQTQAIWGCLPGASPNPCEGSLTTTYLSSTTIQPRRVNRVETPARRTERPVDCFYVYPTVVSEPRLNAGPYLTAEVQAILRYEAARFSQVCDVYAPIYRQVTALGLSNPTDLLAAIGGKDEAAPSVKIAYADVVAAWRDYLANHNRGRGVVLIGHSQGSGMLMRLIIDEIDRNPPVRAKVVSAILPGGNVVVERGGRTGDFANLPTCASKHETGCVIAWSTYASRPSSTAYFGRADSFLRRAGGIPDRPGTEAACVNPAELSGDGGRLEAFTRREPFPGLIGGVLRAMFYGFTPTASTPWVSPGERYRGSCVRSGRAHVLRIRPANAATVLPLEAPWPDWGLHFFDLNLALGNLLEIVDAQITSYSAAK
ncbi:MAG: DUF3089 domain-containing protein [Solirubrobacteraceae bacterium]|nr:DUF3089 domain-containing protein [Solirubrobacteraceae bacterium]